MASVDELRGLIEAKGAAIRELKSNGADKATLQPHIDELLVLKTSYQEMAGEPYEQPPDKTKKANPKAEAPAQPEKTGPSKKDLKKLEKKEKKKEAKGKGKEDGAPSAQAPAEAPMETTAENGPPSRKTSSSTIPYPIVARPTIEGDTVFFSQGRPPVVAYAAAHLTKSAVAFVPHPATTEHVLVEPQLFLPDGTTLFGDLAIARFIVRRSAPALAGIDAFSSSEVDQWLDCVHQYHLALPESDAQSFLSFLNSHLELRTYLVGYLPSLADAAVYIFLQQNRFTGHMSELPHLSRWFDLISTFPLISTALDKVSSIRPAHTRKPTEPSGSLTLSPNCPPLEGAAVGKVVTRFPPEPSGHLHIGHAKALLLNDYYAKHYKGRMLVRFDDTNPSKEKDEYEQGILQDMKTMGVQYDQISHTSDYFELTQKYAEQMINEGLAYMDNTPQEKMQEERLNRTESVHRNNSVEDNMARFKTMLNGGEGDWCLRAKIEMSSVNGTMRDPVIYRANLTPHHRTGTKYKAYPTYDLACPIVDSIEGVTHALRTTEYNDRDEQYYWILNALRLRPVKIQGFSRLNFVQTELSKRKLTWFVENKYVDGWNDPRFPTIQGVIRRGVSVDALRAFILSQGASRRTVLMEWDSFWSINRQGYEHSAPRYMGLFRDTAVKVDVEGGPEGNTGITIPLHPKFPENGSRVLRISNKVLLEGQDAETLEVGEEITLTRWGNVKVLDVVKDQSGKIEKVRTQFRPDGDPRKTKKRITWLADVDDLVPMVLTEFDYLITKKKLEEDEDFKQFINPVTKAEVPGIGDPNLRNMKKGDVVQLERRGFYICDRPYVSTEKPLVLFMIPDGKTKAMSTLSGALKHV